MIGGKFNYFYRFSHSRPHTLKSFAPPSDQPSRAMGKKNTNNVISLSSIVTNATLLKMSSEIESLKKNHRETCEMAARAILYALDLKDHYTFGHSVRVAYFSLLTGKKLDLSERELYDLELAALFHDIGKIGTPDHLLNKKNRLNVDEFKVMKQHPEQSYAILHQFEDFEQVATYAKHHHERYDGRGYPDQLKGEKIPLLSRIILIADTFDAMVSSRPYRKRLPYQVAFEELRQFAGTQFDPNLVNVFIEAVMETYQNSENTFELSIVQGKFERDAA